MTVSAPAGGVAASGSFDLKSRSFTVDGKGAGIDVAKIEVLRRQGIARDVSAGAISIVSRGRPADRRLDKTATLGDRRRTTHQ